MTKATFERAPKSTRASALPGYTLRKLTAPAKDVDGRTWPKGAKYQPSYAGNQGVTVEFVGASRPMPAANDAAGWDVYRARQGLQR